jgi:hypothetical protein
LAIAGARWSLTGAEAVLLLRTVITTVPSTPTGTFISNKNTNAPTPAATSTNSN